MNMRLNPNGVTINIFYVIFLKFKLLFILNDISKITMVYVVGISFQRMRTIVYCVALKKSLMH